MSRWFRHYAGMMRDEKLVRVALRSKQPVERVLWVWGAILESAAEIDDGGRYDLDVAEVAYFLRADESDVDAIILALAAAGRVAEGGVVKWGNRQFQSDKSKERVAAHRERKRGAAGNSEPRTGNDGVTARNGYSNAPEAETELDTERSSSSEDVSAGPTETLPEDQPLTAKEIVDAWNIRMVPQGFPRVERVTGTRQKFLKARIRENTLEDFQRAMEALERSAFCRGENRDGWRADFDFFVQSKSFTKLLEGAYDH